MFLVLYLVMGYFFVAHHLASIKSLLVYLGTGIRNLIR